MASQSERNRARARILAVLDQLAEHGMTGDREDLTDRLMLAAFGPPKVKLPNQTTCAGCGRIKIPGRQYAADPWSMGKQGFVRHGAGDLCSGCYNRQRRGTLGPCTPRPPESAGPARFPISPAIVAQMRTADPEYAESVGATS
jgi:hypothetical protein